MCPDKLWPKATESGGALAAPKVSQTFVTQGLEAAPDTSPAYLSQLIRSEVDKWAKVVQQSGVQLD